MTTTTDTTTEWAPSTALIAATDNFLVGMGRLCDRLYREAVAKGASDAQAVEAVKRTLIEFMSERVEEPTLIEPAPAAVLPLEPTVHR